MVSKRIVLGIAVVVCAMVVVQAKGPWCFVCKDVFHPAICQSVAQCGDHEVCHIEKYLSNNAAQLYTSSCKDVSLCKTRGKRDVSRSLICDECCNGTLCNGEGCGVQSIKTAGQTYCLSCSFVQKPSDCDKVDVCTVDRACSVATDKQFNLQFYKLGCRAKTSCPTAGSTLSNSNICCQTDLCNSNEKGMNPSLTPAKPKVSFNSSSLVYERTYAANEIMKLVCDVTGGPLPTVTWTFDDGTGSVPITSGFTIPTNGESVLSIPAPDKSNSGQYSCNATNSLGSDGQQLTVVVKSPPQIQGNMNISKKIQYQEDITLDCNVTMDNSTTVNWILPPSVKSYTIHKNNSLTLYNVHSENEADYSCVAGNADGNTTKTFSIAVNVSSSLQTTSMPCTCPNVTAPTCMTLPPTSSTSTSTTTPQTQPFTTTTTTSKTPQTNPSTTTMTSTTPQSPPPSTTRRVKTLPTANAPHTSPKLIMTTAKTSVIPATFPSSITISLIKYQFQSESRPLNIMQCPISPTGVSSVTWRRLVHDFDHSDPVYIANAIGVLTISTMNSLLKTGVYECSVANKPVAQFVVYATPANNVQCYTVFGDLTTTEGTVMKAWCPPCTNPPTVSRGVQVHVSDFICTSAILNNIIPASGGNVTYLLGQGGNVNLLGEHGGNILVK